MMGKSQGPKRNMAFIFWGIAVVGGLVLLLVLPRLPPTFRPQEQVYMCLVPVAVLIPLIFWFKAFYHWAKDKGRPGAFALIGILGFPIALIVMALVSDRNAPATLADESSKNCPKCGTKYLLSEYSPTAEHIFCSVCKTELPRN